MSHDEYPAGSWRKARRPFRDSADRPVTPGTLLTVKKRLDRADGGVDYILFTEDERAVTLSRGRVRGDTRHAEGPRPHVHA